MDMTENTTIGNNFKKAVTQMLVLHLICEKERYISEITQEIRLRTGDSFELVTPYGLIMKLQSSGKIEESEKRIAPDGRLRQYYCITPKGKRSLDQQKQIYMDCCNRVENIFQTKQSY